jgi:hypothetical protein
MDTPRSVGSRALTALPVVFPSESSQAESTDADELMAAHAAVFAAMLASIVESDGTPPRELVVSTTYEYPRSRCELTSISIGIWPRRTRRRAVSEGRGSRRRVLPPVVRPRRPDGGQDPQRARVSGRETRQLTRPDRHGVQPVTEPIWRSDISCADRGTDARRAAALRRGPYAGARV